MPTQRKARLAVVTFMLVLVAACGDKEAVLLDTPPTQLPTSSAGVPDDVKQTLAGGGTIIEDASFEGGLSAGETLRRFHDDFGSDHKGEAVYAVEVTDSESPVLISPNARMVHVPDVPDAFEGIAPAPGQSPNRVASPLADMFAFYDAATGRMLAMEYVAHEDEN